MEDLVSGVVFDPGGNSTFAAREILVADEEERSSLSAMNQEDCRRSTQLPTCLPEKRAPHLLTIDALDILHGSEENGLVNGAEFDPRGNCTFAQRGMLVHEEVERCSLPWTYQELRS